MDFGCGMGSDEHRLSGPKSGCWEGLGPGIGEIKVLESGAGELRWVVGDRSERRVL